MYTERAKLRILSILEENYVSILVSELDRIQCNVVIDSIDGSKE